MQSGTFADLWAFCYRPNKNKLSSYKPKLFKLKIKQHFIRVRISYTIHLHKVTRYLKDSETIVIMNGEKIRWQKAEKMRFLSGLRFESCLLNS